VLDVRRRREKPTDRFRAEDDGEAARLADRHDRVGKIAALLKFLGFSGAPIQFLIGPARRKSALLARHIGKTVDLAHCKGVSC
jgi:hypothetical protein